jgi:hypothetical protein
MILHVNPCAEAYHDADGTLDRPFVSLRNVVDYAIEKKLIDWRIRYYYENIKSWIYLL